MRTIFVVLSVFLNVILFDSIFFCMLKRKHNAVIKGFMFLSAVAAIIAIMNLAGVHYNIVFISSLVLAFLFSMIFYEGEVITKLLTVFLLAMVILAGDQLTTGIIMLLYPGSDNPTIHQTVDLHTMGVGISSIYIVAMETLFYCFPIRANQLTRNKSIPLLCIPISAGVVAFITNTYWNTLPYVSGWVYILPFIMFLLLIVLTLLFCRTTEKAERSQRELDVLNTQLENYGESYEAMITDMDSIRAFRHDVSHHFEAIRGLTIQEDTSAIAEYIESIQPALAVIQGVRLSENSIIDALIRQKKALAEKNGIRFTEKIFLPKHIGIPHPDICVILSNAIDNAIEACRKVTNNDERFVDISIYLRKPCMFIFIENSIAMQPIRKNGEIISTKKQRQEHGFGLRNIRALVDKHGGDILPEWYDNRFIFNCSIILPDEIWENDMLL